MTSIKKSFFHNVLFLLSNILFPLISFSYASRIIGPEGFGKIQFILAFTQYFVLVAAMGISIFGVREIAKVRHNKRLLSKYISELLIINLIGSIIALGLYLIIIFSFDKFQDDFSLYLLGGLIVFSGFSTLDWFYNGTEEFHFLSIRSITIKSFALLGLFLFVKSSNDLFYYFIVVIFSVLGNNIWNLYKIRKLITFKFRHLDFKRHIPVLLTFLGTTVSISIYTVVDTLLLGFLADDVSVGYYTAAVKINKISIPIATALGVVLIPRITQSIANNDHKLLQSLTSKSFSFICLIGIPITFGLLVFAPEFIVSVSGVTFSKAILTMQITAPLALLIGFGHIFGFQLLIPAGLERKYLIATILGMLISVTLNLILIGKLKDVGTAIATVSGEFIVSLISFYFVYKYMSLSINWSIALKSFLACIIFIPLAYQIRLYFDDTVLRLIIAIPTAALLYFLIQTYIFKDPLVKEAMALLRNKLNINGKF